MARIPALSAAGRVGQAAIRSTSSGGNVWTGLGAGVPESVPPPGEMYEFPAETRGSSFPCAPNPPRAGQSLAQHAVRPSREASTVALSPLVVRPCICSKAHQTQRGRCGHGCGQFPSVLAGRRLRQARRLPCWCSVGSGTNRVWPATTWRSPSWTSAGSTCASASRPPARWQSVASRSTSSSAR